MSAGRDSRWWRAQWPDKVTPMNRSQAQKLQPLVDLTRTVREQIASAISTGVSPALSDWQAKIETQLGRASDAAWLADSLAQTIVCGEWSARLAARVEATRCALESKEETPLDEQHLLGYLRERLLLLLPDPAQSGLDDAVRLVQHAESLSPPEFLDWLGPDDPSVHGYEHFLAAYDPPTRNRNGVYYTPEAVVHFLVQSIDELLRRDFDLPQGLADTTTWSEMGQRVPAGSRPSSRWSSVPFVRVLDPACGSGAFLIEVIEQIHRTLIQGWSSGGCPPEQIPRRWSAQVVDQLLGTIVGFEAMPAPWAIAHVRLAACLARTGCWLRPDERLRIYLTDTLTDPTADVLFQQEPGDYPQMGGYSVAVAKYREPMTVVIGNPPYAGISDNHDPWIRKLLRGLGEGKSGRRSYYHVQGEPLQERKLWLTDDYVKFLRYAQWRIDRSGGGAVGFVTNHGYLDSPTFRGVRDSLLQSFPRIAVVDLHGNVKKRETGGNGAGDESVFATEQGMAAGVFWQPLPRVIAEPTRRIFRGDLWGSRESKRHSLESATVSRLADESVEPTPPDYLFVTRDHSRRDEYEQGFRLPDIMPVATTAVVTARDRLVIAQTHQELLERIRRLRDATIGDDQIRAEFFSRSRSPKYAAGDTRGWRLATARERLRRDQRWRDCVGSCLYRPFDRRSIYWADWMVDWPRSEVMRHLVTGDNLALIARRQMLPDHECNYFWVTDRITIDGVIRSDNRGSESVFPLYLGGDSAASEPTRINFSDEFQQSAGRILPDRPFDNAPATGRPAHAVRWLGFFYAQFHSPGYRQRFADLLRADFPRVFLTADAGLWDELSELGCRLMHLHLGPGVRAEIRFEEWGDEPRPPEMERVGSGPADVAPAHPKFAAGTVWFNRELGFREVPAEVWEYCVGGHQVCRKWLADRRGRRLEAAQIAQYQHIVWALGQTIELSAKIEQVIENSGGWPAAFAVT